MYHFGDAQPVPQDATANANNAASSTARQVLAGLIGGDAAFDGSTQIQIGASPSLKLGADGATVSFWVKPQDLGDATLFAQRGAGGLRLALQGGKLVAQSGALTATSSAPLVAGAWQHVAVVTDGLTLYVKGDEAGKAAGGVGAGAEQQYVVGGGGGGLVARRCCRRCCCIYWFRLRMLVLGEIGISRAMSAFPRHALKVGDGPARVRFTGLADPRNL